MNRLNIPTMEAFNALSEDDQIEAMAYEVYRRDTIDEAMKALAKKPGFDYAAAYVALMLDKI